MLTNYHTHTTRCGHAEGTEEEYILTALRCGYKVLGFLTTPLGLRDAGLRQPHPDAALPAWTITS